MAQFRKKPVVIEAWLFDGSWASALPIVELGSPDVAWSDHGAGELAIDTLEGTMRAMPGDWIIRGVKGELYPCKPDIFAATYEPASTLPAAVTVEGWKLVPVEPIHARDLHSLPVQEPDGTFEPSSFSKSECEAVWRAMLSAAPSAPTGGEVE